MREPSFWWRDAGVACSLLAPLAAAYGAIAGLRLRRRGRRAGVPVICIGNPTVGGAGKTPTALAVARYRPDTMTRGGRHMPRGIRFGICTDQNMSWELTVERWRRLP